MSWSIRSVALNEFNAPSYDFTYDLGNGPMRAGDAFLQAYEVQSDFKWKWAGIGYLAGMFIFNTRTCVLPPCDCLSGLFTCVAVHAVMCVVVLTYFTKEDVRTVPYIEDPERRVAPTRRKRVVWDADGNQQEVETPLPKRQMSKKFGVINRRQVAVPKPVKIQRGGAQVAKCLCGDCSLPCGVFPCRRFANDH
jgi:hypothetical protein